MLFGVDRHISVKNERSLELCVTALIYRFLPRHTPARTVVEADLRISNDHHRHIRFSRSRSSPFRRNLPKEIHPAPTQPFLVLAERARSLFFSNSIFFLAVKIFTKNCFASIITAFGLLCNDISKVSQRAIFGDRNTIKTLWIREQLSRGVLQ